MATKTSKTKTAAAKKPAARKTTARANSPAPKAVKRAPKAAKRSVPAIPDFSIKTAVAGATVGGVLSLLVGKAFFFKG